MKPLPSFRLTSLRSSVLLAAILIAILVSPLTEETDNIGLATRIFYMLVFGVGGYLMIGGKKWSIAFAAIAIPALVLGVIKETPTETPVANMTHAILQAVLQGFLIFAVFYFSLTSPTATKLDRIVAGICGYLILGLFWAELYDISDVYFEDGFRTPDGVGRLPRDGSNFYFSMVTLTTLGYGDISPANSWTRTLASLQAISGTLYIAVFISAIISSRPFQFGNPSQPGEPEA